MPMLTRRMSCSRKLLLYAVYDVLDQLQSDYTQRGAGELEAKVKVFDNVSRFIIRASAQDDDAVLYIDMQEPAPALTQSGMQRAINFLSDSIIQHLENEGAIKRAGGSADEAM